MLDRGHTVIARFGFARASDATIAVLCVAVAIQLLLMRNARRVTSTASARTAAATSSPAPALSVGSRVTVNGIQWDRYPKTAVLLFWSTCQACNAHIEFYQRMSRQVKAHGRCGFVALSIEPSSNAANWLTANQIEPQTLLRIDQPASVGLLLVPTVLIVDSKGLVTDMWVATLDEEQQSRFLDRLNDRPDSERPVSNVTPVPEISATDLASVGGDPMMIDTRVRNDVTEARPGTFYIPADELGLRAVRELSQSRPIVIDCRGQRVVSCRSAAWDLSVLGFRNVTILRSEGE